MVAMNGKGAMQVSDTQPKEPELHSTKRGEVIVETRNAPLSVTANASAALSTPPVSVVSATGSKDISIRNTRDNQAAREQAGEHVQTAESGRQLVHSEPVSYPHSHDHEGPAGSQLPGRNATTTAEDGAAGHRIAHMSDGGQMMMTETVRQNTTQTLVQDLRTRTQQHKSRSIQGVLLTRGVCQTCHVGKQSSQLFF